MRSSATKQWHTCKLVEAVGGPRNVVGGPFGSNLVTADYVSSGVPVIRGTNMKRTGRFVGGEFVFVSEEKAKQLESNAALPGDIIVTQRGTMGQVSIVPQNPYPHYVLSQSQMAVRAKGSELDPEYLYQFLSSAVFERYINISTIQTGLPHINLTLLRDAPISFPQTQLQRRIAETLRNWDDGIEKIDRLIAAKGIAFDHWSRGLLSGRYRIGRRRTNWPSVALTEVALEVTARNGSNRIGIDAVMGVNKLHGMIPMKEHVRAADLSRYKIVRPEAFAYNPMRLNIGSIAQNSHGHDVLVSPDYVAFETDSDALLPAYFDHLRRTSIWSRFVKCAGSGGVRIRIYYEDLRDFVLDLPPVDEQARIVEALDMGRREIAVLERQRDALAKQKRGLMQKLLTGEWTVSAPKSQEAAE